MPTHAIIEEGQPEVIAVYKKKMVIADEQIKSLPTSHIEIVASPGINNIIIPLEAILNFKTSGGAYSNYDANIAGGYVQFKLGDMFSSPTSISVQAVLGGQNMAIILIPKQRAYKSSEADVTNGIAEEGETRLSQDRISPIGNLPLSLTVYNYNGDDDLGNFTGGNENNTLEVTILYSILSL